MQSGSPSLPQSPAVPLRLLPIHPRRPEENSSHPVVSREKNSWFYRRWQQAFWGRLNRLRAGTLVLREGNVVKTFGRTEIASSAPPTRPAGQVDLATMFADDCFSQIPPVSVEILNPRLYGELALGGSLAAGETYARGWWRASELTDFLRLMLRNTQELRLDGGSAWLKRVGHVLLHWWQRNTVRGSRQNISAHYDLGNDFFAQFLDPTLSYSCARFSTPQTDLESASLAKIDDLCQKLDLRAGDHLLEIGTGWGAFALHAARKYGCRVTTTTISREQAAHARAKITNAGLSDRITLLEQDYRQLRGQYDKLVSVEMLEAVGHQFYDRYFSQCAQLLKPGGKFALQSITIADQKFDQYRRGVDFIQRYIFPGGCLPSVTAICQSLTRATRLRVVQLEDLSAHYAHTLALWRREFNKNLDKIRALGYPETFLRLWEYYFCYCEAGFRERQIGLAQLVLA
ncbi:MAG: cyclopropane-fatty-acyl-phospholipid synthase family protein [Pirellulales bacterium]|nr:cyclopropane-fatty-acyl-phospholipid synthase family protein [Pirellulales bacterium]